MSDFVAKYIVQKNLNMDFNYVPGQTEFFDAVDTEGLFKIIAKIYVSEEETLFEELMISM